MPPVAQHIIISALIALVVALLIGALTTLSTGFVWLVCFLLLVLVGLVGGNGFSIRRR